MWATTFSARSVYVENEQVDVVVTCEEDGGGAPMAPAPRTAIA
jgi:hypothetical protein